MSEIPTKMFEILIKMYKMPSKMFNISPGMSENLTVKLKKVFDGFDPSL